MSEHNGNTGDALILDDVKSLGNVDVKRVILSADEYAIPKSEVERLLRKAKTAIAIMHEVVNALEGLK